jgi:hypothetical protein
VKVISVTYLGEANPNSWGRCQSNHSLMFVSMENHRAHQRLAERFTRRFHYEGEKV